MRRTAHARRAPGEVRRRDIADAALRVIAEHGVGGFTAMAIAREVGVSDGAIFRHFDTKNAIVDAALDRVEQLLFEGFPPEGEDPVERVGAFFRGRVAVIREHPGISALVASDELAKAGSPSGAARVRAFRRRSTEFVRSSLAEAEKRRLLAPGLHAEEASVVVLGSLLALAHSNVAGERDRVSRTAPAVWSALERFLRRVPREEPRT